MDSQTAFLIGVGALFCTLVANRFLGERNFRQLSADDKVKLVDEFSLHRSLATYIPLGIMSIVLGLSMLIPGAFRWMYPVAILAALAVAFVLQFFIWRRLRTLDLPDTFKSRFLFQSIAVQIGNVIALTSFAYGIAGTY